MSSPLHLRNARKDELSLLSRLSARAFQGRPMSEALFPAHLQLYPDEQHDFRVSRHLAKFDNEDLHYIVVADEEDQPVGWAVWQSPSKSDPIPEEVEAAKAKALASRPKGLDLEAFAEVERGTEVLIQNLKDALGEEGYKNAWYIDALAVDPVHQRKGIGKMLMQWGHDKADQEHTHVRLMASEKGAKLYRTVGYEEVGSVVVCGGTEYAFIRKAHT